MPFCSNCGRGLSGEVCESCGLAQPAGDPAASSAVASERTSAVAPVKIESVPAVLAGAIREGWPLLTLNWKPSAIIISVATIYNVFTFSGPRPAANPAAALALSFAVGGLFSVISYFAIAAAIRTLRADFRMTSAVWFRMFGFNLLAALLSNLASLAFVIPGLWVGVKLSLTPYAYCLDPQSDQIARTWRMTTGHYWETFSIVMICAVIIMIPLGIALAIAAVWSPTPLLGIVLFAICLTAFVWGLHVQALAMTRWTASLIHAAS